MKKLFLITTFLFLCGMTVFAQDKNYSIVKGICLDERNKVLQNVGVYSVDSTLLAVSDEQGRFTLFSSTEGDSIFASHLAYENVSHIINKEDFTNGIVIKMNIFSTMLPEVEIVGNVPRVAYDNKVISIEDYEINEKGIYLIAKRRRHASLLHLNFTCDTLKEIKISNKFYNLYKDVYGEMHLVSGKEVWQVGHLSSKDKIFEMRLLYHSSLSDFLKAFSNVACATDSIIVTGHYFFYNTELYYNYYKTNGDKQPNTLHHIVDKEGRELAINMKKFGGFENAGDMFQRPIYNPIFKTDSALVLFSFDEDKTIIYNHLGEYIDEKSLTFHKYKHWSGKMKVIHKWDKKVILDETTSCFYTTFVEDGITTIKKIDIENGTAEIVSVLGGFPFIENLRIHNGKAYFLYANDYTNNKRLYEVVIE